MKRTAIVASMLLLLAAPVWAVDLTGMSGVTWGVGYGLGFGDNFKDVTDEQEFEGFSSKEVESAGLSFLYGIGFRHNFDPSIGVRAFLHQQALTKKTEVTEKSGTTTRNREYSEVDHWTAFSINLTYTLMPEGNTMPYFQIGPGIYMPPDLFQDDNGKIGIGGNVGAGVLHFLTPSVALDANVNFSLITKFDGPPDDKNGDGEVDADDDKIEIRGENSTMALQFVVGFSYFFGGQK